MEREEERRPLERPGARRPLPKDAAAIVSFVFGVGAVALVWGIGPIGSGPMGLAAILIGLGGVRGRLRVLAFLGIALGVAGVVIFLLAWITASRLLAGF